MRTVSIVLAASALVLSGCLREPADNRGHQIGYAVDPVALASDPRLAEIVENDANIVTAENHMKWGLIHPGADTYDFAAADQIVQFAVDHDQVVRGHVLVWHQQLPSWVTNGAWTRDELIEVMREHIHTVVGHFRDNFPGVVVEWDVVNEAFYADGSRRPTIFQQVIGDDYIELAFRFAREADPTARLFYNDFYDNSIVTLEALTQGLPLGLGASPTRTSCAAVPKCVATQDLIETLNGLGDVGGRPLVDGLGLQGHVFGTNPTDYQAFTSWTADLGIDWAITELDIALPQAAVTPAQLAAQADAYRSVITDCLESENCSTTVIWGVCDYDSWIPAVTGGLLGRALLYDDECRPKAALPSVWAALVEPSG